MPEPVDAWRNEFPVDLLTQFYTRPNEVSVWQLQTAIEIIKYKEIRKKFNLLKDLIIEGDGTVKGLLIIERLSVIPFIQLHEKNGTISNTSA